MKSRNLLLPPILSLLTLLLLPGFSLPSLVFGQTSPAGLTLSFSKSFSPDTIGAGSASKLTFTITNLLGTPVTDLAFVDNFPAGLTIATPSGAKSTCGGTLSAPAGGTTITFSDGAVASASCAVSVYVTSSAVGTHMNVSGSLTSSLGNSGTAIADLTVAADRPGFSKSFSPSSVGLGQRSRLTFTIDNTANESPATTLDFTDNLPLGMVIAEPANAGTDCGTAPLAPTVTATPGSSLIGMGYTGNVAFPGVAGGASCTVSVDVLATGIGQLDNISGMLSATVGGNLRTAGVAAAALTVTRSTIHLIKSFINDPVPPGGTVTLQFTIQNFSRDGNATDIAFLDDLEATLSGLVYTGPDLVNPCGPGSLLTFTGVTPMAVPSGGLVFSGGSLAGGESCTFSVDLDVPIGASAGAYPNATTSLTAMLDGSPFTGNMATDTLFVEPAPLLTKEFTDDPVGPGGTVTLHFTILNTSPTSSATDISFIDELTTFLPFPVSATPPASGFCGAGSTMMVIFLDTDSQALSMNGGSLAAGGMCEFDVSIDIPVGFPGGTYTNTTQTITATVDDKTVTGNPASDDLVVLGAPTLHKEFTDDPTDPGGTVTLEFKLDHDEFAPADATAIAFTDDLNAVISGLTAVGLPMNDVCGSGSQISGTSMLSLTGGTLAPGESCTFSVTLQVPAGATAGLHTNTTSDVTATISGIAVTSNHADGDLIISNLELTKEFLDDPVVPGDTVTLRFTMENTSPVDDASSIVFVDVLTDTLSGLTATGLPLNDICGMGSSVSGTTTILFSGGSLSAGASCSFDVTLQVPAGAAEGTYENRTSSNSATVGGNSVGFDPGVDSLTVDSRRLELTKEFTDDPVSPGGTVSLEFTLTNLDPDSAASAITFTDNLTSALSGLAATGLPMMDVCGMGSQISGSTLLTLTGGTLAAGASCNFSVTLQVPANVTLGTEAVNTTSSLSGTINGLAVTGAPASDTLQIQSLTLTKAFSGPSAAGGTVDLMFTITNLSDSSAASELAFTDNLNSTLSGLVATGTPMSNVCGSGSTLSGTSLLTLSGGNLEASASCNFSVTLQVPAGAGAGTYLNTTSQLQQAGLPVSVAASDSLGIEPPPTFSKTFSPDFLGVGQVSTLSFTIDNSASALAASSLAFTDNLPAGVVVASTPSASNTCTGTVTADAGTAVISLSGGSVAAGTSCQISVNVTPVSPGNFVNTTGDLTSSSGNSGTAGDTLSVVSGVLDFVKEFGGGSPASSTAVLPADIRPEGPAPALTILPGGQVDLTYTLSNLTAFQITDISFSDDLDASLPGLQAVGLPESDICGSGSQISGTSVVVFTGGTLAANSSCSFTIVLQVPGDAPSGSFVSSSSIVTGLTTGTPVQGPSASASLNIAFLDFEKSFAGAAAAAGSSIELTFNIANPDPFNSATNITFTDDLSAVLPGLVAFNLPASDICGAGSQISGSSLLSFTGGSLAPGSSCSFDVLLQLPVDAAPGNVTNVTSSLEAMVLSSTVTGDPAGAAQAVLSVSPSGIPLLSDGLLLILAGLLALLGWRRLLG